ncbi:MAG: ComEC/Rec2 family competence protein [Clostridia bacterium]|nr:ComEC/Rec2 family competence protein [Clostridia bacterium]
MALLRFRPLAFATICLIVVVAASFFVSHIVLQIAIVVLAALLLLFFICAKCRGFDHHALTVFLILLCMLLGGGRVLWDRTQAKEDFDSYMSNTVTCVVRVREIYDRTAYGSRLLVKVEELAGERVQGNALMVFDGMTPLYYGDQIRVRATITPLEDHIYYKGESSRYVAEGAYAALVAQADVELMASGTHSFRARLADFREGLRLRIKRVVSGDEGDLISALVLGTKNGLSDRVTRDFRRVGLSHLLALSGLHLSILAGATDRFLYLCRVSRRWRILGVAVLCVGYLIFTGCTFSMLRSVLMLLMAGGAFFAGGDRDPLTSLCFSGAAMVLATPGAVFDLSFQMTMLATFGILAFGELWNQLHQWLPAQKGIKGIAVGALRAVIASLFITFSATIAVLPVQWLVFGELSLVAPLSNLAMLLPLTPLLILSVITVLLLPLPAVASIVATITALPAKGILIVTEQLASLDCVISLRQEFVPYIFIPLFFMTAVLLLVDLKKWRALVCVPSAVALLAFVICTIVVAKTGKDHVEAIYRYQGSNEGIVLVQNGDTVLCDLSNGSRTQLQGSYRLAQEMGATDVDVLLLTHYHSKQVTALSRFASDIPVRALWLPPPITEKDLAVHFSLLEVAMRAEIPVTVYERNCPLTVFETGSIQLSTPLFEERSVEPAYCLSFRFGESELLYQSASYTEYAAHANIVRSGEAPEVLILGSHGPIPKEIFALSYTTPPDELVLARKEYPDLFIGYDKEKHILLPGECIYRLE